MADFRYASGTIIRQGVLIYRVDSHVQVGEWRGYLVTDLETDAQEEQPEIVINDFTFVSAS